MSITAHSQWVSVFNQFPNGCRQQSVGLELSSLNSLKFHQDCQLLCVYLYSVPKGFMTAVSWHVPVFTQFPECPFTAVSWHVAVFTQFPECPFTAVSWCVSAFKLFPEGLYQLSVDVFLSLSCSLQAARGCQLVCVCLYSVPECWCHTVRKLTADEITIKQTSHSSKVWKWLWEHHNIL